MAENGNIVARQVPTSGDPTEAEIGVALGAASQDQPDVACRSRTGLGGYLVVWRAIEPGIQDIRGQRINPTGGPLGDVLDLCVDPADQWAPRIDYSTGSDSYLVVWADDRNAATQGRDLYGRPVGGSGAMGTEFAVTTAPGSQKHIALGYAQGLESFVVAWDDDRPSGAPPDLYGQQASPAGLLLETSAGDNDPFFVYSGWQQFPALAWAGEEKMGFVAWQDGRNADNFSVYGMVLEVPGYTSFLPLVLKDS